MSINYESRCLHCEICMGSGCSLANVAFTECDHCSSEYPEFHISETDEDFCADCFETELNTVFNALPAATKKDLLDDILMPSDTAEDYNDIFNQMSICEKAECMKVSYNFI